MRFVNVIDNSNVFADGLHDDTKALQACIDSVKDGGTVYFPDGTYLISAALIFYSNQSLKFSDNAVLLRSDKGPAITKYLLAAYSEPSRKKYGGTHDVIISGGVFDGNKNLTQAATFINTVHSRNITIDGCRFFNGALWHYIELNSTRHAVVRNCVFNGQTYTAPHEQLLNELIQLDLPHIGSYGPVYNCDGQLIDFCVDDTPCSDILITSNVFKCSGSPGIGHHGDCPHRKIKIIGNIFDGPSGRNGKSRGYIIFRPQVHNVTVGNNVFIAPDTPDSPDIGIIFENPAKNALKEKDNKFKGHFAAKIIHGSEQ